MYSRRYRDQARSQRKLALIMLIALVIVYTLFNQSLSNASADSNSRVTYQKVTVAGGDSLWLIASKYCNNDNLQLCIEQIKQLNALPSSSINIGQELLVPVY